MGKETLKVVIRFIKNPSGAAAVEFVLLAPLFAAIMFGGFDLGRYIFFQNELTSVTQEAGRFAMIRGSSARTPATQAGIINFATQRLRFNDPNNVTFTVTFNPDNSRGSTIQIRAQANFAVVGGLLDFSALTLDTTSTNIFVN